MAIYNIW